MKGYWITAAWLIVSVVLIQALTDPLAIDLERILQAPTWQTPLGFDELGRSVLARIAHGATTTLQIVALVTCFSMLIGTAIGLVSGYAGGWVDGVIMRIVDVFLAFPGFLLAIALASILGPGVNNLIIALVAVGWVGYARLVRAQTLSLKWRDYVLVAKTLNRSRAQILYSHILPVVMVPLLVEATFGAVSTIIAEAGLSFLGLGVQPPDPSWGQMIREGTRYLLVAPHLILVPSLLLWLLIWGLNALGERLRKQLQSERA